MCSKLKIRSQFGQNEVTTTISACVSHEVGHIIYFYKAGKNKQK